MQCCGAAEMFWHLDIKVVIQKSSDIIKNDITITIFVKIIVILHFSFFFFLNIVQPFFKILYLKDHLMFNVTKALVICSHKTFNILNGTNI